jgi:hypothetical protein
LASISPSRPISPTSLSGTCVSTRTKPRGIGMEGQEREKRTRNFQLTVDRCIGFWSPGTRSRQRRSYYRQRA